MKNKLWKKRLVLGILILFVGASFIPNVSGNSVLISVKDKEMFFGNEFTSRAPEVWVDDDYYDGGYNDGHTWGYDAFDNIQDGVDNVDDYGILHVKEGVYDVFKVEGKNNIDIIGEENPIVTGYQLAYDVSYPDYVYNVVFINNSNSIYLEGFHIIGTEPTTSDRDFSVFYQNSNGTMRNCNIDANNIGNMNALAIRVITYSSLTIENCTAMNYGRIGIYAKTGTSLSVLNCTLIGQTYTVYNQVNYGIEIEGIDDSCEGIIKGNKIYNHDNTQAAAWSSAGIIVDSWRYYGPDYNCMNSTVIIENNEIYENMHGVEIVPNENIDLIYNVINDNNYGAISATWFDGSTYHSFDLNAIFNWWGDPTGPYHEIENPDGLGDEIYGDVIFNPWLTDIYADIQCYGTLSWEDIVPGDNVEGTFTIENTGYSELSWEINEYPDWGDWTFKPNEGTDLKSYSPIAIGVEVVAPDESELEFTGEIKIVNSEDPDDYCVIDVSLATPVSQQVDIYPLLQMILERFPNAFPLLRHLMGL